MPILYQFIIYPIYKISQYDSKRVQKRMQSNGIFIWNDTNNDQNTYLSIT